MAKLGVLTSGGDAPGMNAAIRAVVRTALYGGFEVVGIERGFAGLLAGEFHKLKRSSVADIIHRGGTILHTARSDEFRTAPGMEKALENLRREGIGALVVIGGNGSFKGAAGLRERGAAVVGVPATIDNDVALTELSIGFDTAVNTVVDAVDKVRDTATSHERTFVIEVMGRDSGFIALHAGVAGGAESILVPEISQDLGEVCRRIMRGYRRGKLHSIIIVAEGAGRGFDVGRAVQEATGLETRVIVLGHVQRGGTPTALDRALASRMGARAVELLAAGRAGLMTAYRAGGIEAVPLADAAASRREISREVFELAGILSM